VSFARRNVIDRLPRNWPAGKDRLLMHDTNASSKPIDWDSVEFTSKWFLECRKKVRLYLRKEKVHHGKIGTEPAWFVSPHVSLWAIESMDNPGWVGWWAICGDVPTDYVSSKGTKDPRAAIRAIAKNWMEWSLDVMNGKEHLHFRIDTSQDQTSLAPLLKTRAETLSKWANDDALWE
jgi:hypothetical protein